ncbi:MAG: sulfatase-like hydrolase/transferase, partial [Aeoliella sp.]
MNNFRIETGNEANVRDFYLVPLSAAVIACVFGMSARSHSAPRPNIVLIMVDDMGYSELGVTGQLDRAANSQPAIETPNIDTLAQQGLMVNNFYATPICASTRGALMTGFHNGHSSIDRNGGNNGGNALRNVDVTMAQNLKASGYTTGQYGKWGVGGFDHTQTAGGVDNITTAAITHPDATPASKGFDEYYGYLNQVHAHDYYVNFLWEHDTDNSGDVGGMQKDATSTSDYSHDLIADKSLEFVTNHADATGANPFFLYLPYTIPHSNFDPPNDAIRQAFINAGYSTAQANYAAMMKRMDNSVGDIVERLKDPNDDGDEADSVYDDTVILFLSDNGGTPQNSLFGGGGNLRGQKGSVFEGGTKTPFIAHWNGTIAPGQVDDTSIAGLDDLFATFSDLAGAERELGLDGVSIAGLFTGGAVEKRDTYIFEGNGSSWSIRMGDWKLVGGSLYNLATDPSESSNVAGANPAIAALMQQIALDEGVLSDAGTGGAQTTHIVQYKTWNPQAMSTDWEAAGNWSGGTQFNTRGTAANNFSTGPANNWITTIDNLTGVASEAVVDTNSEVLALELQGSSAPMKIKIAGGASLMARNGAWIRDGSILELDGGQLHTMRAIHVQAGGMLTGNGEITTSYDTTGTPFDLKADVVNNGVVDIFASSGGTSQIEVVANGGFESGAQIDGDADYTFEEIDAWETDGIVTRDAAKPDNSLVGAYRGLIASRTDGPHNTRQNTGHVIELGEELTFSFAHRGFSGWDTGADEVEATVFYFDDAQTPQVLEQVSVMPAGGVWNTH